MTRLIHSDDDVPFIRPFTVFLSSTIKEFADARDMIEDALQKNYIKAFVYDHFTGAAPSDIHTTTLKKVEESDLLVVLFGEQYGIGTIEEYLHARNKNIPCLVYVKKLENRDPNLESFLKKEVYGYQGGVTYAYFERTVELPKIVARDIQSCLVDAYRQSSRKLSIDALPAVMRLAVDVHDWYEVLGYQATKPEFMDKNTMDFHVRIKLQVPGFGPTIQDIWICCYSGRLTDHEVNYFLKVWDRETAQKAMFISDLAVLPSARHTVSQQSYISLLTLDEFIEQTVDFDHYLSWLKQEICNQGIDKNYIELTCTEQTEDLGAKSILQQPHFSSSEGGITKYVKIWMEDRQHEHLTILGEFGTGKTWFLLHYALDCLTAYNEKRKIGLPRPKLPLVISLRDFAKSVSIESLFSEFFFKKHQIGLPSYAAFKQLNRMGKLLLLFDGFDEMSARVDRQQMINNFWEFARILVPGCKVILTCRTEHFPDAMEGRALLSGELQVSTSHLSGEQPQFEVVFLEPFNEEQIHQALVSRQTNPEAIKQIVENENLRDLARRPLLVGLIIDALEQVQQGAPVDISRIYLYAIRIKLEREIEQKRTFTSLADKLYFLCEVCWELLAKDKPSLNYRQFPDHIRRMFGLPVVEQNQLDHWAYDMQRNTILIRNSEGDYTPAHRSMMEFFVAYKYVAELGILAQDFLEMAHSQSFIDKTQSPIGYLWQDYFSRSGQEGNYRREIAPIEKFLPTNSLNEDIGKHGQPVLAEKLTKNVLIFAANMVNPDPSSLDELCCAALEGNREQAWNALNLLPFLKYRHGKDLALRLVERSGGFFSHSGVCWVLGELGANNPSVITALENTLNSLKMEKKASPSAWWEAAFALEKLGHFGPLAGRQGDQSIKHLIETLPSHFTLDYALQDLHRILCASPADSKLNQCDIVALVKNEIDAREHIITELLPLIAFGNDSFGRRVYFMVWLCGHLGIRESLEGILAACQHPHSSVRNCAAEALGKLNIQNDAVLTALMSLLTDNYYRARFHAAWSLGELKATKSLPELERAIRSEDVLDVRRELIRVHDLLHHVN